MNPVFQDKINQSRIDYRITIAISFNISNTDVVYLTSHPDGVAPTGAVVIQDVIKSGSSESARADILKGEFTIGGGSVKIVDINGQISQLLADKRSANKGVRGQRIQEWAGAAGMAFADYHLVNSFRIDGNVVYNSGVYTINSRDIQLQSNVDIFDPDRGNLSKSVTDTQSHIPILTTDTFTTTYHDAGHSYRPLATYGLAKIGTKNGFEIIAHNGIFTHATDGPSLAIVERGIFGTRAIAHDIDPSAQANRQPAVTEYIYREGAAPKILLETLQGQFYGGQPMPGHWGVGIDPANIDIPSFENSPHWNTADDSGTALRFEEIGRAKAKTWYQSEILRWITSLIRVNNNGSLTLQAVSVPTPDAGYSFAIDESNCISVGAINHNQSAVANIFSMQWGWSPELKQYLKDGPTFIDGTSISREGIGKKIEWKMKGVHSGSATDTDIATVFDGVRASHAAPPITTTVVCNLTAAGVRVGQNVRLKINNLLDANTGQSLSRTFRVDQKSVAYSAGKVSLRLFGAPLRGGAISRATGTTALNDLAYGGKTPLSTQIPIANNATTGGAIAGGATMSAGEYAHLGDLSIDGAINVQGGGNALLWIRGFLTVNEKINLVGVGAAGGSGSTVTPNTDPQNALNGDLGIGSNVGGGNIQLSAFGGGSYDSSNRAFTVSAEESIPFYPLKNNGYFVAGLPDRLDGTGGTGGRSASDLTGVIASGGNGGSGGGGLIIICRGIAFGANGGINSSGGDGLAGGTLSYLGKTFHASAGAGGSPGGVLIIVDGNHSPPVIAGNVVAKSGNSPLLGTPLPANIWGQTQTKISDLPADNSPTQLPTSGDDRLNSVASVQYLPPQETAQQDANPVHKLIPPAAFTAADGTLEPSLPANQGRSLQQIEMGWQAITDPDCSGYEIQSKQAAVSSWHTAALMSDPASTAAAFTASQGVAYDIRIRAISSRGADGHSAWVQIAHTLANSPAAVEWGQLDKASAGIPADSATAGAAWGQNIGGQPADSAILNSQAEANGNLLRSTAAGTYRGGAYNYKSSTATVDSSEIVFPASSGAGFRVYDSEPLSLRQNTVYTLSFRAKISAGETLHADLYPNVLPESLFGGLAGWQQFSVQWSSPAVEMLNCHLRFFPAANSSSQIQVGDIKLEERAERTPWTPHPFDASNALQTFDDAPALLALKPAAAGADVTGANVAMGADTGAAATGQRVFIDPVTGELTVENGGNVVFTAGINQASSTDPSAVSGISYGSESGIYGGGNGTGPAGRFAGNGAAPVVYSTAYNGLAGHFERQLGTTALYAAAGGPAGVGLDAVGGKYGITASGFGGFAFYALAGAYGPFTGAHEVLIKNGDDLGVGDIVCLGDKLAFSGLSDFISVGRIANGHRDFAYGVISGIRDISTTPDIDVAAFKDSTDQQIFDVIGNYRVATVNAVGEGLIPVCDETGGLNQGDLLMTSKRHPKRLCKQITRRGRADHSIRNYTVAQVEEVRVEFDLQGLALAAVTYKRG